ncbi:hypothetical protein DV738_g5103, partial [Chaetothyriales sp. CBS 135597]
MQNSECTVAHTEPDASVKDQSTATEADGDPRTTAATTDPPERNGLNPELVHDLFQTYPGLKARLNAIYQSTRQPTPASAPWARTRRGPQSEASAEDTALANGLAMLQRALREDAGDQGINAFASYVKTLASS